MMQYPETQAAVLHGQWTKEGGGCNLNPTWASNPKFLLTVSEPGTFKVWGPQSIHTTTCTPSVP